MNSKTPLKLGKMPSNIQWLWWFQIAHAPRMIMDLRPLWTWPSTLSFVLAHQSSKEKSSGWGVKSWKPTFCKRIYHTCQANTHETSKWSIVSPAWDNTQRSWILSYHFWYCYCLTCALNVPPKLLQKQTCFLATDNSLNLDVRLVNAISSNDPDVIKFLLVMALCNTVVPIKRQVTVSFRYSTLHDIKLFFIKFSYFQQWWYCVIQSTIPRWGSFS